MSLILPPCVSPDPFPHPTSTRSVVRGSGPQSCEVLEVLIEFFIQITTSEFLGKKNNEVSVSDIRMRT